MRFGLLGPLTVEGRPVGSGKIRSLLAALLMRPGRVVPSDDLKLALWGDEPPASATASLHNHVARLRRLLDSEDRVRAVPPGYVLRVDPGELDTQVFERHARVALDAYNRGDWPVVAEETAAALALWRGTPLGGLYDPADGEPALVQRLGETRLLVLEWKYEAELRLGRHEAIGPELAALTSAFPLREAFHRQLMLVLHRTGRQAEALAVHQRLRRTLVEELGVDPGPAVQEAHREILRDPAPRAELPTPAQLPPAPAHFTGRDDLVAALWSALTQRRGRELGLGEARVRAAAGVAAGTSAGVSAGVAARVADGVAVGVVAEALAEGPAVPAGMADGMADGARAVVSAGVTDGARAVVSAGLADGAGAGAAEPPSAPVRTLCGPVAPASPAALAALAALTESGSGPESGPGYESASGPASGSASKLASRSASGSGLEGERTPRVPAPRSGPGSRSESGSLAEPGPHSAHGPHSAQGLHAPTPPGPAARHESTPAAAPATPAPLAVITGMAGVGKSALAVHVAHALREEFPDGQLYLNLRGATPGLTPLPPIQALAALLNALGVDSRNVPDTPDAAAALLRSRLAPTRTLLVLDDAASAAQVRPLLPAGDGCAVVVTSRSPLAALDGATRFPLAPMTAAESLGLLRAISGRQLVDGASRLVELCGRLPLALRVAAARLAARRALSPDALAGLLDAEDGRLDHLEYDDLSVRRSLAVALGGLDPDAALALRRLGALDLPAYEVAVVARLMGLPEQRAGAALDRLVEVALLEEISYGRYAPHDLVRDFARELAARDDGRGAAVERGLRWYAEAARQSGLVLAPPDREGPARVPEPVGDAAPFPDSAAALAWGDRELPAVLILTERYARRSSTVFLLVRAYFSHLQYRGKYGALRHLNRFVLSAARASGDRVAQAHALGDLAGAHFLASRIEEALALNDEAIALWRELGERGRTQRTLANRGMLLERLGRHAEAAEPLRQSLAITRELDDAYGEAIILSHLGNLYEHTDARVAIAYHERSLATGARIGSELLVHTAHCNIGYAHLTLGEWAAAVGHFERALRILGEQGDWHGRSQSWVGLVRVLGELGRTDEAYAACVSLIDQAVERCDAYTAGLGRREYGRLERSRGRLAQARVQWELALTALEGGDPKAYAEVRELLAGLESEAGLEKGPEAGEGGPGRAGAEVA
ncbi:BTAD domain-containing putative transcriptional regulator [Streptomyces sp. NPDC023838]|uniref:AfsR/SARP family transcriptional regulator n=1 Tax=Streptomyces sp. NPDC023838 TaxID=3154325 RepID=UPI0033F2C5A2